MFLKIFNPYVLAILLEKKLFPSVLSTNMFQLPLWNLKKNNFCRIAKIFCAEFVIFFIKKLLIKETETVPQSY